eukprot:SAG22_NODE_179_length_16124_cov_7.355445_2_plen_271_part_00
MFNIILGCMLLATTPPLHNAILVVGPAAALAAGEEPPPLPPPLLLPRCFFCCCFFARRSRFFSAAASCAAAPRPAPAPPSYSARKFAMSGGDTHRGGGPTGQPRRATGSSASKAAASQPSGLLCRDERTRWLEDGRARVALLPQASRTLKEDGLREWMDGRTDGPARCSSCVPRDAKPGHQLAGKTPEELVSKYAVPDNAPPPGPSQTDCRRSAASGRSRPPAVPGRRRRARQRRQCGTVCSGACRRRRAGLCPAATTPRRCLRNHNEMQ